MRKLVSMMLVVLLLLTSVITFIPSVYADITYVSGLGTSTDPLIIYTSADAYVYSGSNADKNYGGDVGLVTTNTNRSAYIKFGLSNISADKAIKSADLVFTRKGGTANIPFDIYYVADDSWGEGTGTSSGVTDTTGATITYNHRPQEGASVGSFTSGSKAPGDSGANYSQFQSTVSNFAQLVSGEIDGTLSLYFKPSSTAAAGTDFYSKENMTLISNATAGLTNVSGSLFRPYLKIVYADAGSKEENAYFDYRSILSQMAALNINYSSVAAGTINLPRTPANSKGSTVTWSSNNENVVNSQTGVVTPPTDANVNVTLALTVSNTDATGIQTLTKAYTLTVPANMPDDVAVDNDLAALSSNPITYNGTATSVILPTTGSCGSTITWTSDKPSYITDTGSVLKRNNFTDEVVTMTATVTKNSVSKTQATGIPLTVSKLGGLAPEADTTIKNGDTTNRGTSGTFFIGNGYVSYLRFDLSKIPVPNGQRIATATLKMYKTAGDSVSNITDNVFVVNDNSWTETNLSYTNAPVMGPQIGKYIRNSARQYYTCDISSKVQTATNSNQPDYLSLCISNNTVNSSDFVSREGTDSSQWPRIEVTYTSDADTISCIDAKSGISLGDISNVKQNLTLPLSGANDTAIAWATSDASVVTADGIITRGTPVTGNKTALLTATITKGTAIQTYPIYITVIHDEYYTVGNVATNGDTIGNIEIKKNFDTSPTAKMIVAVYDASGKLTAINAYDNAGGSVAVGENNIVNANMAIPSGIGNGSIKVFIWDDTNSMTPYALSKNISYSN